MPAKKLEDKVTVTLVEPIGGQKPKARHSHRAAYIPGNKFAGSKNGYLVVYSGLTTTLDCL